MTNDCFNTLTNLYEKKAPTQKWDLKNKLCNLKMEKYVVVASFFTNISQVKYQLAIIGVVIDEDELIQTTMDGIPSSWENFLDMVTKEKRIPTSKYYGMLALKKRSTSRARLCALKR